MSSRRGRFRRHCLRPSSGSSSAGCAGRLPAPCRPAPARFQHPLLRDLTEGPVLPPSKLLPAGTGVVAANCGGPTEPGGGYGAVLAQLATGWPAPCILLEDHGPPEDDGDGPPLRSPGRTGTRTCWFGRGRDDHRDDMTAAGGCRRGAAAAWVGGVGGRAGQHGRAAPQRPAGHRALLGPGSRSVLQGSAFPLPFHCTLAVRCRLMPWTLPLTGAPGFVGQGGTGSASTPSARRAALSFPNTRQTSCGNRRSRSGSSQPT